MKSSVGEFELNIPRDRNGSYEPQIVINIKHICQTIKKWTMPIWNRSLTISQLAILLERRLDESLN